HLTEAKVIIEHWRRQYDTIRPHTSLGYRPPAPVTLHPADQLSAMGGLQADRPSNRAKEMVT
ncbi:MAG: integrase core domain-containing protein, partial [Pseudomonadota bacterium]